MGKITLSVSLEEADVERLDAIAEVLAERAAGATITRPHALRVVIDAGLDVLGAHFRQSGSKLKR